MEEMSEDRYGQIDKEFREAYAPFAGRGKSHASAEVDRRHCDAANRLNLTQEEHTFYWAERDRREVAASRLEAEREKRYRESWRGRLHNFFGRFNFVRWLNPPFVDYKAEGEKFRRALRQNERLT